MLRKFIAVISAALCAAMTTAVISPLSVYSADINALDRTCRGYGQGREVDGSNRPTGAQMFNDEYERYGCYAMLEDDGKIYLTFDQGYENGFTASILDTLKKKNVRAVFFLTGDYARRNEELVRRMISDGHILGNHGMKHSSLPKLSPADARAEIMSLHEFVKEKYGYEMKYFRPPCGEYSEQAAAITDELGYKTLLWSFAYQDWDVNDQPDPSAASERMISAAHGGEICLLHSVSSTNAEILPQVIDGLRAKGYEFALPDI